MTEKEKAEFVHTMLSSDNITIPVSLAEKLVECKAWLQEIINDGRAD